MKNTYNYLTLVNYFKKKNKLIVFFCCMVPLE